MQSVKVKDNISRSGHLFARIEAENPLAIRYQAQKAQWLDKDGKPLHMWSLKSKRHILLLEDHNGYVNTGLQNALNREFGLGGAAVGFFGVSNNNTAVTATTTFLNGSSAGTTANTIIKTISPAATLSGNTVTAGASFANADFPTVFIIYKLGMLNTSTDAGTGLIDVIGGASGSAPYAKTFALDLTGAGQFNFTPQIAVTAVAV